MTYRLKIQTKLLLAFTAVGLLSILVGVFAPLRVITLRGPMKSRELLKNAQLNIFDFYKTWVDEPRLIGEALNANPEFVQAFAAQDRIRVRELLEREARKLGFTFLPEEPPSRLYKYRYLAGVLWSAEEYEEWANSLHLEPLTADSPLRLISIRPTPEQPIIIYLAGNIARIQQEGKTLGGLLIGRPMIRKDLSQSAKSEYLFDDDFFSQDFEKLHQVSIDVIGAESRQFRRFLDENPEVKTALADQKQVFRLQEARIFNVASQIIFVPVEDLEGELVNIVYLHVPLPPETYAWNALKEIFYYGVASALTLAFLMALLVSRTISKPIKQLSEGAAALSRGNLDYQVRVSTNDEVGDLARTFIEMRQRLGQTLEELHQRAKTIEEKNVALDQSLAEISRMRDFTEDILRSIDSGVITLNLSGSITKINTAARRILRIPEDVPETACLEYIPDVLLNGARRVLQQGQPLDRFETQVDPRQGPPVPIDLNVSLLESADHIIGVVVTFYDLTQVRTLKEQIRRQERLAALGTLTAGIAHEIRNPLGIIKGAAEILQKRFSHLREEEGLSGFILEEVQRLSSVLTDFLDFARPQIPNFSPADLNPVLRRSLQLANLPGAYPTIEVELDLADRLPILQIDPDQCQQAFLNLILNAAQAMPEGGRLTIRSRVNPNPREVIAEIQDTGAGIGQEAKAEIFNPFFTTKDEGTGLGLSIVHRIVENHNARISFESDPGKGTLFRISFPVDKSPVILAENHGKTKTGS